MSEYKLIVGRHRIVRGLSVLLDLKDGRAVTAKYGQTILEILLWVRECKGNVPYPWYGYAKWTYNVHIYIYIYIYIYITQNIGISKFEKYVTTLFRYKTFLLPLSLKVLRHKEREVQFFYSGFFICPPSQHVWHPPQRSPRASENQLSSPEAGLISTNWLFQNLPKFSARFRCVTSFALASLRFPTGLLLHLWVTRPFCVRAWTPVLMLHLSNPCTEPKGSQPN